MKTSKPSVRLIRVFAFGLASSALGASQRVETAPSAIFSDTKPVCSIDDLRRVQIPDTTIDSVAIDPADGSCRVTATVTHPPASDQVKVFIALPVTGWNSRFRGTGGGGYSGGTVRSLQPMVARGYAAGATDAGNAGVGAKFTVGADGHLDWQAIRDNAYLGIHDMTVVGKALVRAFYGREPRYSYFVGGSTGGRQGLAEAQRFPDDYDGIVSNFPAINRDRDVPARLWAEVIMLDAKHFVTKAKLDAATAAAIAACDGDDGVVDGVIDDPTRSHYDPAALVGRQVDGSRFSEADADIIRKIWEGPRGHGGRFLWYGPMLGANLFVDGATEGTPLTGHPGGEVIDWFRYYLLQDPKWDWTTLTPGKFELLFNQSVEQYGAVIGTDNPDLSRFRARGGKIIMTHGLADQIIPAQGSTDYVQRVQRVMGGPAETAQFLRLFLVPAGNHGYSYPAPSPSPRETVGAIIRWVEQGEAPERLIADLEDKSGKLIRTRPLFPYPQRAKFKGTGSTDDAANFDSFTPEPLPGR